MIGRSKLEEKFLEGTPDAKENVKETFTDDVR
jgi:hypothetical protein